MHTTAMGRIKAVPALFRTAISIRPSTVVMVVIKMGRILVMPASTMASRRSFPSRRSWLM